jgi:hypothetical protein
MVWSGPESVTLHKLTGASQDRKLGAVAHVASTMSLSTDLKRATIGWRDYRGDAWMYRVVKP